MLLKKPTVALCSSGSLSTTFSVPTSITSSTNRPSSTPFPTVPLSATILTPANIPIRRKERQPVCSQWKCSRPYATVRDGSQSDPSSTEPGLPAWPQNEHPSPYDIFNQAKTAPYSKRTFYQLVKLYHPDRHGHTHLQGHDDSASASAPPKSNTTTLSHATRLERYRLVVAANNILSDASRRRAYDLYGAGWAGTSDMSNVNFREADSAWRHQAGSAAGNATWEDWERWREQFHDGSSGTGSKREKQSPVFMSNGLFVAVLSVFVVVGSWGQATRAGHSTEHLLETREQTSHEISEDMWRRRLEKAALSREDRVDTFLRSRERWISPKSGDARQVTTKT